MELVVTLVITGILFAVGAVSYEFLNNATDSAEASSRLDRVVVAELAVARDFGFYSPYTSDLLAVGSGVVIVENGAAVSALDGTTEVSVAVSGDGDLGIATMSPDGCIARIVENLNYGAASTDVDMGSSTCSGTKALEIGLGVAPVELASYTLGGSVWED